MEVRLWDRETVKILNATISSHWFREEKRELQMNKVNKRNKVNKFDREEERKLKIYY